jgi:hypothetical protein
MSAVQDAVDAHSPSERLLPELRELLKRVAQLPTHVRHELDPILAEVVEESRFRTRILEVAREAIGRLKLDLEMTQFDLDATKRERGRLRELLDQLLTETKGADD